MSYSVVNRAKPVTRAARPGAAMENGQDRDGVANGGGMGKAPARGRGGDSSTGTRTGLGRGSSSGRGSGSSSDSGLGKGPSTRLGLGKGSSTGQGKGLSTGLGRDSSTGIGFGKGSSQTKVSSTSLGTGGGKASVAVVRKCTATHQNVTPHKSGQKTTHCYGAYSVTVPDQKKRNELLNKAATELAALEKLKRRNISRVSTIPRTVGGTLSEEEVRRKQQLAFNAGSME
ncbi:period circadian protein-like [Leucoraja erinacea]|uniref:period circadian protein-like n=1 Tax=Leucoraja erinaceus TaxID=7782 RepID=UPI002457BF4E|nr:period circadian protein-like [Leucoraja erinacea]